MLHTLSPHLRPAHNAWAIMLSGTREFLLETVKLTRGSVQGIEPYNHGYNHILVPKHGHCFFVCFFLVFENVAIIGFALSQSGNAV